MLSFRFLIYVTTRILVPPFAFLCSLAFTNSLFIVLTGSVVLASLNVDPVLYTAYPFILPPGLRKLTSYSSVITCSLSTGPTLRNRINLFHPDFPHRLCHAFGPIAVCNPREPIALTTSRPCFVYWAPVAGPTDGLPRSRCDRSAYAGPPTNSFAARRTKHISGVGSEHLVVSHSSDRAV